MRCSKSHLDHPTYTLGKSPGVCLDCDPPRALKNLRNLALLLVVLIGLGLSVACLVLYFQGRL